MRFKVFVRNNCLDLRRQPSRKMQKKHQACYKKRQDRSYLKVRTYQNYISYLGDNPNVFVTQMDTVYNDITNCPFIQTFKLMSGKLLFAVLHTSKTAQDMLSGVNLLEKILGRELFEKHCHVILTDLGSEFVLADAIEIRADGTRRTRLFYCDPMQSVQKGSLENNHGLLRYILPKETDLKKLELVDQNNLNIVFSHINSYQLESLGFKSPLCYTLFLFP